MMMIMVRMIRTTTRVIIIIITIIIVIIIIIIIKIIEANFDNSGQLLLALTPFSYRIDTTTGRVYIFFNDGNARSPVLCSSTPACTFQLINTILT